MIAESKIKQLVDQHLKGSDQFLVALKVSSNNDIQVFIDADSSVTIDDCVALSRHIEGSLDRDMEDFELKVMSAGADRPFSMLRQYKKHVGRKIDVVTTDEKKIRGILLDANKKSIKLQEEKTVKRGKSKKTITGDELTIPMSEIELAKVVITF